MKIKYPYAEQRALADALPILAHNAVVCGLTETAKILNEAVKKIGWEMEKQMTLHENLRHIPEEADDEH